MIGRKLEVTLFFLGWAALFLWYGPNNEAAGVTRVVYNESQGSYSSDLQAALDAAHSGDVLRIVGDKVSLYANLNWQVDGVTLDLNGATITSYGGQSTIKVGDRVYRLTIKNGTLKTSDTQKSCIEVSGYGEPPVEIRLEDMCLYGGKSLYLRRNGRLEWFAGQAQGSQYGVLLEYTIRDFTGVFNRVTFTRASQGAIYYSGLPGNNPLTVFELHNCRFGDQNNSLAGPALWVEAGSTQVTVADSRFAAWGSNKDIVHVRAAGTVTVTGSYFHRGTGCALSLEGITHLSMVDSEVVTREGYSESSYNPALTLLSFSEAQIENNRLTGPGLLGLKVSGGEMRFTENKINGFVDAVEFTGGKITTGENILTARRSGWSLKEVTGGQLEGDEIRPEADTLSGDMGILIQNCQNVILEDLLVQGWSTGTRITGSTGLTLSRAEYSQNREGISIADSSSVRVSGTFIRGNNLGASVDDSKGVTLQNSRWENNSTGLALRDTVEAEISGNLIACNNLGLDLLSLGEARLKLRHNDIYDNAVALRAPTGKSLSAPENYWGSSSGPYHESLNPQGRGDVLYGDLDFTPWSPYCYQEDNLAPGIDAVLPADLWSTSEPLPLEISVTEDKRLDRVSVAICGKDGEVIFQKVWWGKEWNGTGSLMWETASAADGPYTLTVLAVDAGGREARWERLILLDRHPPANPQVQINDGAEATSSLTVELKLWAEDTNGVAEVLIANEGGSPGRWEPYQSNKTWELLPGPPGLRRVVVRFRDWAGWESQAEAAIEYSPLQENGEAGNDAGNEAPSEPNQGTEESGSLGDQDHSPPDQQVPEDGNDGEKEDKSPNTQDERAVPKDEERQNSGDTSDQAHRNGAGHHKRGKTEVRTPETEEIKNWRLTPDIWSPIAHQAARGLLRGQPALSRLELAVSLLLLESGFFKEGLPSEFQNLSYLGQSPDGRFSSGLNQFF